MRRHERRRAEAGAAAADAVNVVLKDVAQKFEAFGKEASVYFEGRARLLSVAVAIALAFLAHVDAVDLFRTYLRDPNARAKVIEQSEAVTAQHKAAAEAAKALKAIDPNATLTPEEVKKQIETLKNDWKEAIAKANSTVKQYADLGVPLGWTDERIERAKMYAVGVDLQRPEQERGRRLRVAVEGLRQEPVAKRDMGSGADLARRLVLSFPRGIAGRARRAILV